MTTRKLASFPNSRIRPRPATRTARTLQDTLLGSGFVGTPGTPIKVLDRNDNRTYWTVLSRSTANEIRFDYAVLGTEGTPPPNILTQGFVLPPSAGLADEPSPQELWMVNMCNIVGTNLLVSIEEGEG